MEPLSLTQVVLGLAIGLVAGAISGSLGVGGGAIMVPAMVLMLGVGEASAQGTSLLVILPTALVGVISHFRHGSVDFSPTWLVGLSGTVAAAGGALLALNVGNSTLRIGFALFLLFVGGRLILSRGRAGDLGPEVR
jgi:uncharacterized membrane protein YfcA